MKVKKITYYFLLFVLIMSIKTPIYAQDFAKKGVADFTKYDFGKSGNAKLNGKWEFFPNKFLKYSDFDTISEKKYVYVPKLWTKYKDSTLKMPSNGYGTYRIKIKTDKHYETLALRLKRIYTSYNLWVDDSLILQVGKPAFKKENSIAEKKTLSVLFSPPGKEFYLTLQISNYHHRKGGIEHSITIGKANHIFTAQNINLGFEMFIFGALLMMALFHLGLFALRKNEKSLLYFALLLIAEIIHISANGEVMLKNIIPELSWEILIKTDFISNYLILIFFLQFFRSIFPNQISKVYVKIIIAICLALLISTIFLPASIFTKFLIYYEIISGVSIIYILISQIIAIKAKEKNAVFSFIGLLILFASVINDILFEMHIIYTLYLISLGLYIFTYFQSYWISKTLSSLYKETNKLSKQNIKLDTIKSELIKQQSFNIHQPLILIARKFNANKGYIFKYNNKLIVNASYPQNLKNKNTQFVEKLFNQCKETQEPVIIENAYIQKYFSNEYLNKNKTKSAVFVPFVSNNDISGGIYLENSIEFSAFTKANVNIIELLSDQVIGIVNNTEIYEETKHLNEHLGEIVNQRTSEIVQQREQLLAQRNEIERQNEILNKNLEEAKLKNTAITDSINYSKKIQKAILPSVADIKKIFHENFIFFKPKDILSGDFYWADSTIENDNEKAFFAAVDCTGHGVPGALMSIVGNNLLEETLYEYKLTKPSEMLDKMQGNILEKLHQYGHEDESKDGMDLALISFDKNTNILEYAGARNPLILIRDNEIIEYKADKMSIGGAKHARKQDKKFTNNQIKIQKGDIIYMFSDGYPDQVGGKHARKFMINRFKVFLHEIHSFDLKKQLTIIENIFYKWKGENVQTDDILVSCIKF